MKVQGKQGIHSVVVFCLLAYVLFIVVFSLKDAFINNADTENTGIEIGALSCEMALETEQLQGGRYLIIHKVFVW